MSMRIGYAGMTHLGLNSAVAAADRGFDVVCYDADAARIATLGRGEPTVVEPDLPELLRKHAARLRFTTDVAALAACGVVYVAPDVPTDDAGRSDLGPIDALIRTVDAALPAGAVMVILSQVPPGFTRARARPGRVLHYQVETLIFGRAVERARFPERFIVGCADPSAPLPAALAEFLGSFGCPVLPMRYESAELAKISINMCLVASVSVANTLAEVCEAIGADWSEIAPALKLDRRIGPYSYLAPGLGIAGGNLERDLATVCEIADRHGTDAGVVRAWVANSRHRKDWAWRTLERLVLRETPQAKIAVLGLTYKEDTHSTKNSPSLALLAHLGGRAVVVHDPVVRAKAQGLAFAQADDPLAAADGADAVCVMTPWALYRKLSLAELARRMRGRWLLDPYRTQDPRAVAQAGLRHVTLGVPAGEN